MFLRAGSRRNFRVKGCLNSRVITLSSGRIELRRVVTRLNRKFTFDSSFVLRVTINNDWCRKQRIVYSDLQAFPHYLPSFSVKRNVCFDDNRREIARKRCSRRLSSVALDNGWVLVALPPTSNFVALSRNTAFCWFSSVIGSNRIQHFVILWVIMVF